MHLAYHKTSLLRFLPKQPELCCWESCYWQVSASIAFGKLLLQQRTQDSNKNALVWLGHLSLVSQWKILESSCQKIMYVWSSAFLTEKPRFKVYLDDFHLVSYLLYCGSIDNQGTGRDREEDGVYDSIHSFVTINIYLLCKVFP